MRIFITGGTGFIGKELVNKLSTTENEIHVLERYVTGRYILDKSKNVYIHYANLTDYEAIQRLITEIKPEITIHTAAISAVSYSYEHFIEVTEADYLGTINLAESCRKIPNFKQFIFAGTSEEYGMELKNKNGKLTKDSNLKPNSPYAVAKVASDYYLRYMSEAYNFPFTILRPFNTYGRKNNKHFFIERTITQMLTQKEVYLGDPEPIRDWIYVDDHVNGYIKAIENENAIGKSIPLGTGKGYSIRETADIIAELIGFKGNINWNSTPKRPLDATALVCDTEEAKMILNWKAEYTLEEGLKKTIAYWKNSI